MSNYVIKKHVIKTISVIKVINKYAYSCFFCWNHHKHCAFNIKGLFVAHKKYFMEADYKLDHHAQDVIDI